jgi:hypothetical protein
MSDDLEKKFFKYDENSVHGRDRNTVNRENAQKSSGPVSEEGKAISSMNALKHGLTGNTVLVKSDNAEAYQRRLDEYAAYYKPANIEERHLVQSIHDTTWRLDRILNMESTIFAKGRIELEGCFYGQPEDQRDSYIEDEIANRNEKKLRNLHLLEARLQRQRNRDTASLRKLIAERKKEEAEAAEKAKTEAKLAPKQPKPQPRPESGFVFSTQPSPSHADSVSENPLDEAA